MNLRHALTAILWLAIALPFAAAQQPAISEEREDVFGAGGSFNSSPTAVPSFAGALMYAHRISAAPGLYSFTLVDIFAMPNPAPVEGGSTYIITTTPTTGLAQYTRSIGGVKIYALGTIGASAGGSQLGWAYSAGGAAYVGLGKGWCLIPNIRLLKSSLNGEFQGIFGLMLGWGK
jgi:hypothetical protein